MPVLCEMAMRMRFPKDVVFYGATIPMTEDEKFLAFDDNGQLWAYAQRPLWSDLASKWIPQDEDTPRLIFTLKGDQVNGKDLIGEF